MGNKTISIEHEDTTYGGQLATIKSTSLGMEDHGILSAMLHCEWEGGGVGVGGFRLDQATGKPDHRSEGTAYGLDHIIRIMETVGVSSWEALKGKQVIVLFKGQSAWGEQSVGIAGVLNDKVFIPKDHATAWREREHETEIKK